MDPEFLSWLFNDAANVESVHHWMGGEFMNMKQLVGTAMAENISVLGDTHARATVPTTNTI
jgi:hypothetical protein